MMAIDGTQTSVASTTISIAHSTRGASVSSATAWGLQQVIFEVQLIEAWNPCSKKFVTYYEDQSQAYSLIHK